jgi:hypothetical protein
VRRLVVLGAVALAASACGGGGSSSYTRAASAACLRGQGVTIERVPQTVDFVAWSAEGGAFRARLSDNFVTVSFGPTLDKANAIADAYRRFAARNVGVSDVLYQQGNAVLLWHLHPSDTDLSTITGCLKK